jgi:hypothetical protein
LANVETKQVKAKQVRSIITKLGHCKATYVGIITRYNMENKLNFNLLELPAISRNDLMRISMEMPRKRDGKKPKLKSQNQSAIIFIKQKHRSPKEGMTKVQILRFQITNRIEELNTIHDKAEDHILKFGCKEQIIALNLVLGIMEKIKIK